MVVEQGTLCQSALAIQPARFSCLPVIGIEVLPVNVLYAEKTKCRLNMIVDNVQSVRPKK